MDDANVLRQKVRHLNHVLLFLEERSIDINRVADLTNTIHKNTIANVDCLCNDMSRKLHHGALERRRLREHIRIIATSEEEMRKLDTLITELDDQCNTNRLTMQAFHQDLVNTARTSTDASAYMAQFRSNMRDGSYTYLAN